MIEFPIIQGMVTGISIEHYRYRERDAFAENQNTCLMKQVVKLTPAEKKLLDEYVSTYKQFRVSAGWVIDNLHDKRKIPVKDVVKVHNFDYDEYFSNIQVGKRNLETDVEDYPWMFPFKDDKHTMNLISHLYQLENIGNTIFT